MINLDPNREKSHRILDLVYNDTVYIGSYEDCQDFISEQPNHFTYKII